MFPGYLLEAHHVCWHWGNFKWEVTPCNAYFSCFIIESFSTGPGVLLQSIMSLTKTFSPHISIWDNIAVHLLLCFSVGLCLSSCKLESPACIRRMQNLPLTSLLWPYLVCSIMPSSPVSLTDYLVSFFFLVYLNKIINSFKAFWELFLGLLLACLIGFLHLTCQSLLFSIFLVWK